MASFSIETKKLQSMVAKASRGAANNKISAITSYLHIVLKNGELSLTTTDATNYLSIIENGVAGDNLDFVVIVDLFSKLVSKTSVDIITIDVQEDIIYFKGNGTYKIPIQLDVDGSPIQYPVHTINAPEEEGVIKTADIKSIILHNKPSLAVTLEAPYLTGYYCTPNIVMSTDQSNLCFNNVSLFKSALLVSPIVFDLLSMTSDDYINYKRIDNMILFTTSEIRLFAVMMNYVEDYPEAQILPYATKEYPSSCTISKTAFLSVIERLSIFIKDNEKNALFATFTKDGLILELLSHLASETIPYIGSTDFKEFTCCIDTVSMKKQIAARAGDNVNICYGDSKSIGLKDDDIMQIIGLLKDPRGK